MKLNILLFLFMHCSIAQGMEEEAIYFETAQNDNQALIEANSFLIENLPEEIQCHILSLCFEALFNRDITKKIPNKKIKQLRLVCHKFEQFIKNSYLNFYIKYLVIQKLRQCNSVEKAILVSKYKIKNLPEVLVDKKLDSRIILVLLAYLDCDTAMNTKDKYTILQNGFINGHIKCIAPASSALTSLCVELNDASDLQLIKLLLEIRSKIPSLTNEAENSFILFDINQFFVRAFHGHYSQQTLECLVNNCDFKNKYMSNSLTRAAFNGDIQLVKELLDDKKHIKICISDSWNALHWAIMGSSQEVLDLLIFNNKHENDPLDDNDYAITEFVIRFGSPQILEYLLSKFSKSRNYDQNFLDFDLPFLFFSDAASNNEKAIILLKYGINIKSFYTHRTFRNSCIPPRFKESRNSAIRLITNSPNLEHFEKELNYIKRSNNGDLNESHIIQASQAVKNKQILARTKLLLLGSVAIGLICYQLLKPTKISSSYLPSILSDVV